MRKFLICLPVLGAMLMTACRDESAEQPSGAPLSAAEMYARAKALLRPNVERAESDVAEAFEWTRRAAEAGYEQAQTDLGALYMYGSKVTEQNGREAYMWFRRAAEQGNKAAHVFLGDLLYAGNGVQKDVEAAKAHWRTAAEAGLADAQYRLGRLYVRSLDTAQEGLDLLVKATRDGALEGVAAAACDLGNIYARGYAGCKPDMEKAAHWYAMAAEQGDVRAQFVYALMLFEGEGVPRDAKKAETYLRLAAGRDYVPAIKMLVGILAVNGEDAATSAEMAAWKQRLETLESVAPAAEGREAVLPMPRMPEATRDTVTPADALPPAAR